MSWPSLAANARLVCVLGMHRSGTSLITRMLNVLGVYLGPDERLMKPQEDNNPRGFWEHQLLTDLNDAILVRLGGSWHEPPTFFPGWESAPELANLRQKARAVIREDFAAAECWGWKDPRTCLTLPFWRRLAPPMQYVLCLRNPVDVAHSLHRRDGFSAEKSAKLWLAYVASALAHTAGQPRHLVFYEDVVRNWQSALRRLARFVDAPELAEQDATQSAVREFCEEELQHHRTSVIDAADDATLPFPAKSLYVALRVYAELDRDGVSNRSVSDAMLGDCVDRLGLYAVTAQTELDGHRTTMVEHEEETRRELERLVGLAVAKDVELGQGRQAILAKDAELDQTRHHRDRLLGELDAARQATLAKDAELDKLRRIRDRLLAEAERTETLPGWLGLGLRRCLRRHGSQAAARRSGPPSSAPSASDSEGEDRGAARTSLQTSIGFLGYLLRRFPAVLRAGQLPRRPREFVPELRAAFDRFNGCDAPLPPLRRRASGRSRLLFVSHNLGLEGAPIVLLSLASSLDPARYDVVTLSMEDGPLRARYAAAGLPIGISCPIRDVYESGAYQAAIDTLSRWGQREGIDLVFANTLMSFWGVSLARRMGIPSVWCIHESVDWRAYFKYLPVPVAREAHRSLSEADRLVFVADATRRLFVDFERPDRVRTIHNGLDLATIEAFTRANPRAALRAAHGIAAEDRVISVIGTTCERKGQLDFLKAALKLQGRRRGLWFYVVGARLGSYLTQLQQFVQKHDLTSVVFVDETPKVYEYYWMSDIFVCSSYEESFPRVILEAMAFRLPIVSTNVYGIPETLTDGSSGLLVPAGDADALATGVDRLLDDPHMAERLATNAYSTLTSRFTQQHMIEKYGQLFAECLPVPATRSWARAALVPMRLSR